MMALLIILAVIILIALLRFGVALSYNEDGLIVRLRAGFFSFKLYPAKKKRVKKKKKFDMKVLQELKPTGIKELRALLPDIKSRLSKIKRRFLIKRLDIEYTAAGNDPSSTAITFGRVNALLGVFWAALHNNFRIKRIDFRVLADFESNRQKITLDLVITIAVWEVIAIFFTVLPLILSKTGTAKAVNNANGKIEKQNKLGEEVKQNG